LNRINSGDNSNNLSDVDEKSDSESEEYQSDDEKNES